MTVKGLYLANCDWNENSVLEVLSVESLRTLYEGTSFEMPIEIEDLEIMAFRGCTIITK